MIRIMIVMSSLLLSSCGSPLPFETFRIDDRVSKDFATTIREVVAAYNEMFDEPIFVEEKDSEHVIDVVKGPILDCGIPKAGGCTYRREPWHVSISSIVVDKEEGKRAWVVAHELGHVLGLEHASPPQCIMGQTYHDLWKDCSFEDMALALSGG